MGRRRDENKDWLWRSRVEAWRASGSSVRQWCRREAVPESAFYAWRRELARRDAAAEQNPETIARADVAECSRAVRGQRDWQDERAPAFVRLISGQAEPAVAGAIEIRLRNGRAVGVAPGFDPETLVAVIAIVERSAGRC